MTLSSMIGDKNCLNDQIIIVITISMITCTNIVIILLNIKNMGSSSDAGVHKLGERLQEISNSASKEFSLEKAMAKMKGEWEHVSVEF